MGNLHQDLVPLSSEEKSPRSMLCVRSKHPFLGAAGTSDAKGDNKERVTITANGQHRVVVRMTQEIIGVPSFSFFQDIYKGVVRGIYMGAT